MAGVNAGTDFAETGFPIFPFPAMRWVGVHSESFVTATDFYQHVEIIRAHGRRAGMNLVREINSERTSALPKFVRLFDEAFLAFFQKIVITARPKTPRITRGHFPAKGHTPEHRNNFYP